MKIVNWVFIIFLVLLFTNEEIAAIRKEYDFREKAQDKSFIEDSSCSIFTEHNLDTTENEGENGDDLSKSTILAPFNTPDPEGDITRAELQKIVVSKKTIKFCSKLREYNRRYERDNNSQQDNGVYVQAIKEPVSTKDMKTSQQTLSLNTKTTMGASTRSFISTPIFNGNGMQYND